MNNRKETIHLVHMQNFSKNSFLTRTRFFLIVENGSPDPWSHHIANARPPPSNMPPSYTSLPAELVSDFGLRNFWE